jgi:hypothetical protein
MWSAAPYGPVCFKDWKARSRQWGPVCLKDEKLAQTRFPRALDFVGLRFRPVLGKQFGWGTDWDFSQVLGFFLASVQIAWIIHALITAEVGRSKEGLGASIRPPPKQFGVSVVWAAEVLNLLMDWALVRRAVDHHFKKIKFFLKIKLDC